MGEPTFLDWVREKIAGFGWVVFIWGIKMTEDEYREAIYQQEKAFKESHEEPTCQNCSDNLNKNAKE